MTEHPFFTVLIPTYNRAHLIAETINSVLGQTFTSYEIVVVDDGSTDNTAEVVTRYGDRVVYFRQRNAGPGKARNAGIALATGEYVAFLDSDDLWLPEMLSTIAQTIEENDSPTLVGMRMAEFEDGSAPHGQEWDTLRCTYYDDYLSGARYGHYVGCGHLVARRQALLDVGGLTHLPINAEDHDLTLKLGTSPGFVWIDSPALIARRIHKDSLIQQTDKTADGLQYLIRQERKGLYPGGTFRAPDRRSIIAQHARGAMMGMIASGNFGQAFHLYWKSWYWQMEAARFRFLFGFPLLFLAAWSKQRREGTPFHVAAAGIRQAKTR